MAGRGRQNDDDGPDGPVGSAPSGPSGGDGDSVGDADADFDYDDRYGGYGDYADGGDADDDDSDADGSDADGDDADDRAPWYSWGRWKYIGGTLFLVLGLSSVGYVLWDIIDLLPKPVTVMAVRAALRESPGRITDVLALSGMISFGPPAGVDLMFGATQAAKTWSRKVMRKERAVGRKEERKAIIAEFRERANGNAELHRIIDEVENERR